MTREQFEKLIADDALLEYAEYVGNYYGTPLQPIREAIEAGTDIVMDVDVVGALKIKKRLPGAVLVFIAAPSFDALRQRLVQPGRRLAGGDGRAARACAVGIYTGASI